MSIALESPPGWSVLAYQIAGDEGLQLLHATGKAEERELAKLNMRRTPSPTPLAIVFTDLSGFALECSRRDESV